MPKTTRGWGRGKWRGAPYWRSPSGHSAPTTPSHRPGVITPPRWASAGHPVTSPTAKAATDLIPASHRLRTERLTSPAHCRIFVRRWRRVVLTGQVPSPSWPTPGIWACQRPFQAMAALALMCTASAHSTTWPPHRGAHPFSAVPGTVGFTDDRPPARVTARLV
jgi:hypothetical protein